MLKMITDHSESRTVQFPGSRFARKLEPEFTVAELSPNLYNFRKMYRTVM
jgi:hypothetical protein